MLDTVFLKILDMSLAASLVIAVVLVARLCLKRAPKVISYALWAIVLFRLLCPVTVESAMSVLPEMESVSRDYTLTNEPITVVGATEAAYRLAGDVLNGGIDMQHVRTTEKNVSGGTDYASASPKEVILLFGQYVWLAGIAVMLIRAIVQTVKLRRRLVGAVPMGKGVFLADHIDSPFVMGLIRPNVYLPSALRESEREYILLHERHHIRRGDHIMRALAFVALCVHWFNPLVWTAFILSGRDMEMSCDEAVVRKLGGEIRADYAASLLRLSTGRRAIAPTPLAFGEGDTGGRIRNLARWKKPLLIVVIMAVVVCVVLAVCLLTDPITEKRDVLAGSVYQLESSIKHDSYTMIGTNEPNAKEHVRLMNELGQFWITADMHLYVEFEELETEYWGALETYEMSSRMQELIDQRVTDAYILRRDDQRFLLFAQTKKGDTLYAYGWEDISERDDYHSDDTRLYALWWLESVLKTDYDLSEFFGISLIHSVEEPYACLNVFGIAEMPGYAIVGFAGSMSDPEHMSDMGYAVFKAYGGKEGYRLLDWHVYPDAVTNGTGIYIAEHPAVLSENGRMADKNTYDVILSANEDLAKIVRHGDAPNEGVVSVIDSEFSMTVFSWKDFAKEKSVSTVFYNQEGQRMIVEMPARVSVSLMEDNARIRTVALSKENVRTLLNALENAPLLELTHPVYSRENMAFTDGYVIRVEDTIRDEYALHEDMKDCFAWEYNGEYFIYGYKDSEDGKHIQKLDWRIWGRLEKFLYPMPERITVMKYVDETLVTSAVLTDAAIVAYWYEMMKAPEVITSLASNAVKCGYEDGYVLRMEYAEEDVARDGVPYIDTYVWRDGRRVYYNGYCYPNNTGIHTSQDTQTRFDQLGLLFSSAS